jgi:hypothetical protein
MAAVTTNYGFDVPTSSDLVKNGATQIALLGQDLDTFLFRPFTRNAIINGGFDIWQRGTTFNSIANYTADRWVVYPASGTLNATQSSDVPSSPYFNYSLQVAGVSSSGDIIRQRIESAQSTPLAGQTVTLSVYAKSSAGTAALKWNTQVPSATDNFTTVVQDQSGTFSATPAGTWTRYTATFTVSVNAVRGYELRIFRDSAASSNTTLYAGIQLEVGSQASPFARAGGTIQGELAACQRYYFRSYPNLAYGTHPAQGQAQTTTAIAYNVNLPQSMRVTPTAVEFSNLAAFDSNNLLALSGITLDVNQSSPKTAWIGGTVTGAVQYRSYFLFNNNNATGYLGLTAEL